MLNNQNGLFIAFVGVPGVGKSTVANQLAKQIGAKVFIEPGEEAWPIDPDKSPEDQVGLLEKWVCESNSKNFREARELADRGHITVADAGIFLMNKKLIYADCCKWWYGKISDDENTALYQQALFDWNSKATCPDVLVLFEVDKDTWLQFLKIRNRAMDDNVEQIETYDAQQALMAHAAQSYAEKHNIPFIKFKSNFGSPEQSALLLKQNLLALIEIDKTISLQCRG